jgi:anti-anti-sigma factor
MSDYRNTAALDRVRITDQAIGSAEGLGDRRTNPPRAEGRPQTRVQTIERTAIIRFEDAEIIFEEAAIQAIADQLSRLIENDGHTRLLLNFGGVRYLSSEVLGILAALQAKIDPARGRIQLCGLDPLLRDMVRITQLDKVFDVCGDEADALGLLIR